MALPTGFNSVKQFQAVTKRYVNRSVKEDFSDLNDVAGNWTPDASSIRGAMRTACTHVNGDSLLLTVGRIMFYYFVYGKAKALQPDIYGLPKTEFDTNLKYRPQIFLHFGSKKSLSSNLKVVKAEISFRLANETSTSITQTQVNTFATKVKTLFAAPTRFSWNKGKLKASYYDDSNGYRLQILAATEEEAKRVITEILKIQNHTPDWEYLTFAKNENPTEAFPSNPGTELILGQSIKKPEKRPSAEVYFRYATLQLHHGRKGINLVDTTGRRQTAIEKTY